MINYNPGKRKILERDCFVHNGHYFSARISVYEDGKIECWGIMDRQEFLKKASDGWITVDIPDGEELSICNQRLVVSRGKTVINGKLICEHKWITQDSFVKEILDAHHSALGHKCVSELCYAAFQAYEQSPTTANKEKLRFAYSDVPEHNRKYVLGDQDLKDGPIKTILGI